MCYNTCNYFSFNPMTGDDKCTLPKDADCPMDEEVEKSNCFNCDECFHSDLFDGELKCEITGDWFDIMSVPFDGKQDGECSSFKDE